MEDGDKIYEAIVNLKGHFYVCGDVKMADDVTSKVEQIMMKHGNMTSQEAKDYLCHLRVIH